MAIRKLRATILLLFLLGAGIVRPAGASYYLTVGSYSPEEAESLHRRLAGRGYPVYLLYGEQQEVRIGSYDTREKAKEIADKLRIDDKLIARVREEEDLDQYQVSVDPTASDREVSQETSRSYDDPRVQKMMSLALDLFGHPYKYGGTRIGKGIDCSFFTQTIFKEMGISIPRTSREQYLIGKPVEKSALKAGDLLFFQKTYYSRRKGKKRKGVTRINHVGIYIGNGEFIHATINNNKRVTISKLDEAYFVKRFAGARRVLEE